MEERPFNGLSCAEAEALHLLSEELGECVQAVSKLLRHGKKTVDYAAHPPKAYDNVYGLMREIGDVFAAADVLAAVGMVSIDAVADLEMVKLRRLATYQGRLHHIELSSAVPNMEG